MSKKIKPVGDRVCRSFAFPDLSTNDDGYYIEGHAAVYDQPADIDGWFTEVVERGAFDNTDFDDVLFCVNHDLRKIPLARCRRNNGNSTMEINTDDKGLHIRASVDAANNNDAKSLYSAIKRGDIDGMSLIMFISEYHWEDLDTDNPTMYITRVSKVIEVTAASLPYYTGTDITARSQQALENAKKVLENARAKVLENTQSETEVEQLKIRAQILGKG